MSNWNVVLSSTRNLNDVLIVLQKVLALLQNKADVTTIDEALEQLNDLDGQVSDGLRSLIDKLDDFDTTSNTAIQDFQQQQDQILSLAQSEISDLQQAINTAAAAGAGENGWTDKLVAMSSGGTLDVFAEDLPNVKQQPNLQAALTKQDLDRLSSNYFPSQKGDYQVNETLILQEPTMLYGDRGATYNRGGGKQGNIVLNADVGFNLGNSRTYQAGLATPDIVNKKSGNPADQWTLKNLSFIQPLGSTFGTKTAIEHTTRTDGPDRGVLLREVSGTRLKHLFRCVNPDLQTQIANFVVDGVCASNNKLPFRFDGAVNGMLVTGSQVEQNSDGAFHGYMNGPCYFIGNMLEGQPNTFKVEVPPTTGNKTMLVAHGNYFEKNSGDYVAEIKNSASGGAVDFAYNWSLNLTAKDYIKIQEKTFLQVFNKDPRPVTFTKYCGAEYGSDFLSYRVKNWIQRDFEMGGFGGFALIEKFTNFFKSQSAFTQSQRLTSGLTLTPFGQVNAAKNNTFITIPLACDVGDVVQLNMFIYIDTVTIPILQVYDTSIANIVTEETLSLVSSQGRWALMTLSFKAKAATTSLKIRLYSATTDGRIVAGASAKKLAIREDGFGDGYEVYPELPVFNIETVSKNYSKVFDVSVPAIAEGMTWQTNLIDENLLLSDFIITGGLVDYRIEVSMVSNGSLQTTLSPKQGATTAKSVGIRIKAVRD